MQSSVKAMNKMAFITA